MAFEESLGISIRFAFVRMNVDVRSARMAVCACANTTGSASMPLYRSLRFGLFSRSRARAYSVERVFVMSVCPGETHTIQTDVVCSIFRTKSVLRHRLILRFIHLFICFDLNIKSNILMFLSSLHSLSI